MRLRVGLALCSEECSAHGGIPGAGGVQEEPEPVLEEVFRSHNELGVSGLRLYQDFVSEAEEREMLAACETGDWQVLARRRVRHFGYEFEYAVRAIRERPGIVCKGLGCKGPIVTIIEAGERMAGTNVNTKRSQPGFVCVGLQKTSAVSKRRRIGYSKLSLGCNYN